jgi:hypothetical protein
MVFSLWKTLVNKWKGTSDEDLVEAEIECMLRTGIDPDCITIQDVVLDPQLVQQAMAPNQYILIEPQELYIHQIKLVSRKHKKHSNKPLRRALFMPGYGAPVACYFSVFKGLLNTFDELICIDPLGMGCSGRPTF